MSNSLNAQFRKEMEVELNTLRDRVMQLEPERRKEGLEILKRLRMILQLRGWMLDEIRHVCEEEDLDEEEKKTGASVRSAWSDRIFSVYGLALRPAGIDQVLGLEYRLFDALILGHQREFRLEEGRPAEAEGESKVYLRWQKEF